MNKQTRLERVMVYFNSYHSISGSDWSEEFGQRTMKYCEQRIYKLTGLHPSDIPANYHNACSFLMEYFNKCGVTF